MNETIWLWVLGRMGDNMVRELAPSKFNGYSVRCIDGDRASTDGRNLPLSSVTDFCILKERLRRTRSFL